MAQATKLEGYEELVSQVLASVPRSKLPGVLARFPAKTRAAWLTAEQLAALPAETVAAGLTAEQLAALPAEKLAALLAEKMAEAARTGKAYETRLDPPPADPRGAHPDTRAKGAR